MKKKIQVKMNTVLKYLIKIFENSAILLLLTSSSDPPLQGCLFFAHKWIMKIVIKTRTLNLSISLIGENDFCEMVFRDNVRVPHDSEIIQVSGGGKKMK